MELVEHEAQQVHPSKIDGFMCRRQPTRRKANASKLHIVKGGFRVYIGVRWGLWIKVMSHQPSFELFKLFASGTPHDVGDPPGY